jgi:two-component system, OmpR family, phosphate regulon sensor histidine kinase PhoR
VVVLTVLALFVLAELLAPAFVRNGVALRVQDSGLGPSPEDQHRIFERFYRSDLSRSRSGSGGTGVGLTIARGLARVMHGDVVVQSRVGEGSTFTLTLPPSA